MKITILLIGLILIFACSAYMTHHGDGFFTTASCDDGANPDTGFHVSLGGISHLISNVNLNNVSVDDATHSLSEYN